ncbi:hypothetical protein INN71_08000 [Nocardioides sp. ChNu-153]|uniref:hypothetical protein n=1 Tax=unclassified Nocardioides TaxID=2615069 RepID=UPI002405776C|nr:MULTISPECIES: hypothetical protein [unclassified Nocardioides]MDF9716776.1 hypothetical protein [Nocardioides sp. ChNu-99]MDN7121334.1 hypothetical protein [Nocardioides sp. ChNu-153]
MGWNSRGGLLVVAALVLVALGGCGVPSVGEVAVTRAADGTYVAHVKICEGSEPVDGLTLYALPQDGTEVEAAGDGAELQQESDTRELADVDAPGEVADGSSWPLQVRDDVVLGPDVAWAVYGWTHTNERSLDGPYARASTWADLEGDEFLHLTSTGDTAAAPVSRLAAWQRAPCWYQ